MLWDFLWDKMGIQMPIVQGLPDTELQVTEFLHKLILEQNSFAVEPSLLYGEVSKNFRELWKIILWIFYYFGKIHTM